MRPIIMPQLLRPDSNSNLKRVVKEQSSSFPTTQSSSLLSSPTESVNVRLIPYPGRHSEWRTIRTGSALELQSPVEEQQERRERGRMVQRLSTPLYLLPLQQQEKNQTVPGGIEQAEKVAHVGPKKEGAAPVRISAPLALDKDENIAVVNGHDDEPTEESTERTTEVDVVEVRTVVDIQPSVVLSNENDGKETGEREQQNVSEESVPDDADDDDDETPVVKNRNYDNDHLDQRTTPRRASIPHRLIERRTRSQNNNHNNNKRVPPSEPERFHQSCGSLLVHQEDDATNLSPQQVVRRPRYQTFAQPMTMTQTETIEEPVYVPAGPRTRHLTRQSAAFQPGMPRGTETTERATSDSGDRLKYTDIAIRPSETYELGLDGSHHVLELVTVKTYTTLVTIPVMDGGPDTTNGEEASIATTTTVVVESPDTPETNELEEDNDDDDDHFEGFDDAENRGRNDNDNAHDEDENEFDYEEEERYWNDQEDLAAARVAAILWQ